MADKAPASNEPVEEPVQPAEPAAPSGAAPSGSAVAAAAAEAPAEAAAPQPADAAATAAEPAPAEIAAPAVAAAPAKKEDWREAKIRRLTAQLHELRDQPAAESAEPAGTEPEPAARLAEAEIERRARERAKEISAIETFNRMCRDAATAGRQAFPDFDTRVTALREAFSGADGDVQQQVTYNQFVAAALETGQAPAILHQLGGDLDEAARILALPPMKMVVELTRLAGKAPDTSTTRAPKPITPLGSKGAAHTAIEPDDPERADNLPTPEWMKRRNAQEKSRLEATGRR